MSDPIVRQIVDKLYPTEAEPQQYVVILYNRYDESVDCVLGPFDDLPAAQAWVREHVDTSRYRPIGTHKLTMDIPKWAR